MSFEPVDFFVLDTSPGRVPVSGAYVKVLSADGKLVYSAGSTDADGHVGFLLPSDIPFQMRAYKFATSFKQPLLFTVLSAPQTNTFDVSASTVAPPTPNDARLCTAFGYFRDITGAPHAGVEIHVIGQFNPVWVEGAGVLKERVILRTDDAGYVQVNLFRNAKYDVVIQGEEDLVRHIAVPDAPNVNLVDLIFPIVKEVICTPPGPYALAVGEELAVGLRIIGSGGEDLGMGFGDVMYSTSDGNVLNYTVSAVGLTLVGVGPGTASINIKRADLSIVHIPDPGVSGQPLVATVT